MKIYIENLTDFYIITVCCKYSSLVRALTEDHNPHWTKCKTFYNIRDNFTSETVETDEETL